MILFLKTLVVEVILQLVFSISQLPVPEYTQGFDEAFTVAQGYVFPKPLFHKSPDISVYYKPGFIG